MIKRSQLVVIEEIRYRLDLTEYIDNTIYDVGHFEPGVTEIIHKYTHRGMHIIDVGANMGCHTLRFAKLVGKTGRVIAFEPMSYAFSRLEENVSLNNFDNIILEKIMRNETFILRTVGHYTVN